MLGVIGIIEGFRDCVGDSFGFPIIVVAGIADAKILGIFLVKEKKLFPYQIGHRNVREIFLLGNFDAPVIIVGTMK